MFLFKSSGKTYRKVIKQGVHAFPHSPKEVNGDELVLLSKNRADCAILEKQVQWVAKLKQVRKATAAELEQFFPGVGAAEKWKYAVTLYWVRPLPFPFNLSAVPSFNSKRYNTVRGFARLDSGDDMALVRYLAKTNTDVLLDIINNADPESDPGAH